MGKVRVIAGRLKGRKIQVPEGGGVRPTSDRAREALFSILGSRVEGGNVLDLYSGSGALGIEAYSRGAASVTFLEADRRVHQVLVANLARLGIGSDCRAVLGSVGSFQERIKSVAPYRLILADPPYSDFPGQRLLDWCSEPGLLEPEGVLVVERDSRVEPAEGEGSRFRLERSARYGRVTIDFYSARF